ncbi:solute carrier family 22 member 6-B-like [Macrobrachium rosenbergii]|uniref:solute carrier family 22 member 6-B-like n=1 Tax=Macrobrachium rosenbergii TaxID=79674 RepID=UPI0034D75C4E
MINKLDELLDRLGTGWWSILHYVTMGYCMALPTSHALSGAFVAPRIKFACLHPSPEISDTFVGDNLKLQNATEIREFPESYFNNSERYCAYYNKIRNDGANENAQCTEWDFDKSVFTNTITSEFELICDRTYLRATYQSIYMGGVFVGSLLSAILADK